MKLYIRADRAFQATLGCLRLFALQANDTSRFPLFIQNSLDRAISARSIGFVPEPQDTNGFPSRLQSSLNYAASARSMGFALRGIHYEQNTSNSLFDDGKVNGQETIKPTRILSRVSFSFTGRQIREDKRSLTSSRKESLPKAQSRSTSSRSFRTAHLVDRHSVYIRRAA